MPTHPVWLPNGWLRNVQPNFKKLFIDTALSELSCALQTRCSGRKLSVYHDQNGRDKIMGPFNIDESLKNELEKIKLFELII